MKRFFDRLLSDYKVTTSKCITVGTDCSGIEAPLMALDLLGVNYRHLFSSEVDKNCMKFIEDNFKPQIMYDNLKDRDISKVPKVDLYLAGFPCQTFSSLGRNEGFGNDIKGTIFFYVYEYIRQKRPTAFILENVRTLETHDKGKTFRIIQECLKSLGTYDLTYDILTTQDFGIPQSRQRMFIVGTMRGGLYKFPKQLNYGVQLSDILDDLPQEDLIPRHEDLMRQIVHKYPLYDFYRYMWILNLNVSSIDWFRRGHVDLAPCIVTNSKYYIPTLNRYLSPHEALKLQGIPWKRYNFDFKPGVLYKFAGNTISVNVLVALLGKLINNHL